MFATETYSFLNLSVFFIETNSNSIDCTNKNKQIRPKNGAIIANVTDA